MKRVGIVGDGITGRRIGKMLRDFDVVFHHSEHAPWSRFGPDDIVVLAHPGPHERATLALVELGVSVVALSDDPSDVHAVLGSDIGSAAGTVVVGAAMSPGLSGLIARYLANTLTVVDEIHIAVHGTAGPACARRHHRSLGGSAVGWHDGDWLRRSAGGGRELCWFPEPVGAMDCYRADYASPLLLHRTFPEVSRISARRSARRRDRFTARLPMLTPPHVEGDIGALRVEVRGADAAGHRQCLIAGVAELVGTAAAATAAAFVQAWLDGDLPPGIVIASDASLDTLGLLNRAESNGVRLQEFTGVPTRA